MDNLNFNGKERKKHEWKCVIESTCLVTSLHLVQVRMVKTCPKKVNKKIFFCTLNKGQLPIFQCKKSLTFYIPLTNLHVSKGIIGNETYTFYHLYTFQIKKLKGFLDTTEYKIFLIKSLLITY